MNSTPDEHFQPRTRQFYTQVFHKHSKLHLSNTKPILLSQKCAALSSKFPRWLTPPFTQWSSQIYSYHSPSLLQLFKLQIMLLLSPKPFSYLCLSSPYLTRLSHSLYMAMAYQDCEPIPFRYHPALRINLLRHKPNHVTSLIKICQ